MVCGRPLLDDVELAEIERDLDDLAFILRAPARRARALPAAGGGSLKAGRQLHGGLRPRPAAFAKAIAAGLNPIAAAFQAGYRAPNRMTTSRLLRDHRVLEEIERLNSRRGSTGAPAASRPSIISGGSPQLLETK